MTTRRRGYATVTGGGIGPTSDPGLQALSKWGECDTITCAHCQRIGHVPPRADPASFGGMCKICMGIICPKCVDRLRTHGCVPHEKQMEELERAIERRRAVSAWGIGHLASDR